MYINTKNLGEDKITIPEAEIKIEVEATETAEPVEITDSTTKN